MVMKSIDIPKGFHSIFLYFDIVEPRIIGDTFSPLLAVLPVEGNVGDFIHKRFQKIHYDPILRKNSAISTFHSMIIKVKE